MHGVANPGNNLASPTDCTDEVWQLDPHVLCSHSCYDGDPPGFVLGVQYLYQLHQLLRIHLVTHLYCISHIHQIHNIY